MSGAASAVLAVKSPKTAAFEDYLETGKGDLFSQLYPFSPASESGKDEENKRTAKIVVVITRRVSTPGYDLQAAFFTLGSRTIEHVKQVVPFSPNYLSRDPIDFEKLGIAKDKAVAHFDSKLAIQRASYRGCKWTPRVVQLIVRTTKKSGIGHCTEMCAVALDFLLPKLKEIGATAKAVSVKDHALLFIEKKGTNSKVDDYDHYHPVSIGLEIWARDMFPLTRMRGMMRVVEKITKTAEGLSEPVFVPLDSKNPEHQIKLLYSPEDQHFFP